MNTATERQISYINSLRVKKQLGESGELLLNMYLSLWDNGGFTVEAASVLIEGLKELPDLPPEVKTWVPEGMHQLNGEIYKVQLAVHGSGNPYAKRLMLIEPDCGGCANGDPCEAKCSWTARFEYAPGAIKKLSESTKMTLEQAKQFGMLYGTCCVCGRTLTNEESIAAGIGPICAGRFAL